MKKLLTICAVMGLVMLAAPAFGTTYVETFDTDNASWKYGYNENFSTVLDATWVSTGGNPDGHISGASQNLWAVWTYVTTPYGDMTGLTMTIDTMITGEAGGNAQFYVGRGGVFYIDGSWSISSDTTWTTHQSELNSTNFTYWSGSGYTLAEVLEAPDDIGIWMSGGLGTGTGALKVDNFGTIPEPATLGLLLASGLILLRRRFV